MKKYFYRLLARYIGLYAQPGDALVNLDSITDELDPYLPGCRSLKLPQLEVEARADYVLLNGNLHYERDIQSYLDQVRKALNSDARLVIIYYSSLWRPVLSAATKLGLRNKAPEWNWLSHADIANFLHLSDFETVQTQPKVLLPLYVPVLSTLANRYFAPLPLLSKLCLVNIRVARPLRRTSSRFVSPSVSVIVPARNEAGNIEAIVNRLPKMGPDDELIFVEGGSSDDTWQRIQKVKLLNESRMHIHIAQQPGRGKGDAVRKGFSLASNEILMILDADLTVPPEDLPKFYQAITSDKGEFINGSRLVYPMGKRAMRFLNLVANKFFAMAFSNVLGQSFKDTLCGTKAISRRNYLRLAEHRSYFGDFDPFGDFDLIFGAARMGLRIVEVPIVYGERTYGETNISRWRHGVLLVAMLAFAARRLKLI